MAKMKEILLKTKISKIWMIFVILASLILIGTYFSYAMFTVSAEKEDALSIVTGNLTASMTITGYSATTIPSGTRTVTIAANTTQTYTVTISSNNSVNAKLNFYYIGTLASGVTVGYMPGSGYNTPPAATGTTINAKGSTGSSVTYQIVIKNTTTSSKTVTFGAQMGLSYNNLSLPSNGHVITEAIFDTLVEELIYKANPSSITSYTSGDEGEMYTFSHNPTQQQPGTSWSTSDLRDYRYIGDSPNNYITFNNQTWRIIGVFTVEDEDGNKEQRIKIMKDDYNDAYLAYSTDDDNNWTSTSYASAYLNGDYFSGLNVNAQKMVEPAKWYLGSTTDNGAGSYTLANFSASTAYSAERSNTVYSGNNKNWVGDVAFIYPSDYLYTFANGVASQCYNSGMGCSLTNAKKSWMFPESAEWTITHYAGLPDYAFILNSDGNLNIINGIADTNAFYRPTLYLKADVKKAGGTGTSSDPYTLSTSSLNNTFSISKNTVTGGSITLSKTSATGGSTVTFTTSASSGFTYYGATIRTTYGAVIATLDSNTKSFTMPYRDVVVSPKWKYDDFTVMALDNSQDTTWTSSLTDGAILNYGVDTSRHYFTYSIGSSTNARRASWTDKTYDLTNYATYQLRVYEFNFGGGSADSNHATFYAGVSTNKSSWPHANTNKAQTNGTGNMKYVTLNVDITNLTGNYYLGVEMLSNSHPTAANFTHATLIGRVYE